MTTIWPITPVSISPDHHHHHHPDYDDDDDTDFDHGHDYDYDYDKNDDHDCSDISCLSISGRVGWRRPLGSLTKMKMAFWTGQNFNRFLKLSLKIFDPIFPGIEYGGCGNTQENI